MDARSSWLAPLDALRARHQKMVRQWASFGPYYAMFPINFARQVIAEETDPGDGVLDPFAGRGTSVFCAGEMGRRGLGIELNPVGWLYAKTKLNPASADRVIRRINQLAETRADVDQCISQLPPFFEHCFSARILGFLVAARSELNWRSNQIDATVMAIILNYLHGKIDKSGPSALSNQMRQTKCMAPDYSVRWWLNNGYREPPDFCPVEFLTDRIRLRYRHGSPKFEDCNVRLGDSRTVLPRLKVKPENRFRLLLTSPPYCGVTSYYYDQWLRLWMLGDVAHPSRSGVSWKGKFEDRKAYEQLLLQAFARARRLLSDDATIYVRTDARELTLSITKRALAEVFPNKRAEFIPAPYSKATQTSLFGDKLPKPGEYDVILRS